MWKRDSQSTCYAEANMLVTVFLNTDCWNKYGWLLSITCGVTFAFELSYFLSISKLQPRRTARQTVH